MNRLRAIHLILISAFLLSAEFGFASTKLTIGLTLPEHNPDMKLVNGMYEVFRDEVHENAAGRIHVNIFYGNTLGNADSRLRQVRAGIIQMSDPATGNLAGIYPDIQVFSLPYLFDAIEDAWEVLDGPVGFRVAEQLKRSHGIRVLGWFVTGDFSHYSSNRPILDASDFSGKKIRVLSPLNAIAVSVHGASPLPIPFNDLYTALRIGLADGADLSMWIAHALKFYEVQEYMFLDRHRLPLGVMVINEEFYQKLAPELQTIIGEAAKEAIAFNRREAISLESELYDKLLEYGMSITIPTPEQRERLAEPALAASVKYLQGEMSDPTLIADLLSAVRDDN